MFKSYLRSVTRNVGIKKECKMHQIYWTAGLQFIAQEWQKWLDLECGRMSKDPNVWSTRRGEESASKRPFLVKWKEGLAERKQKSNWNRKFKLIKYSVYGKIQVVIITFKLCNCSIVLQMVLSVCLNTSTSFHFIVQIKVLVKCLNCISFFNILIIFADYKSLLAELIWTLGKEVDESEKIGLLECPAIKNLVGGEFLVIIVVERHLWVHGSLH